MTAKGIYRTATPESGAEYAYVDYGVPHSLGEIPRAQYEQQGYAPPFDDLPIKYDDFNPKTYVIALISMPGTADEKTHCSDRIVALNDDQAVEIAHELVSRPGVPSGEYILQVTKEGVGIKSIKIQVKS